MGALVVAASAAVLSRGLWVLALWLRLRAGMRREVAHLRYLVAAISRLSPGSFLDDVRADGAHLRITVPAAPSEGFTNA